MIHKINKKLLTAAVLSLIYPYCAQSESLETMNAVNGNSFTNSVQDFRARAQNSVSPHYSIPIKFTYHGNAPRGDVYTWSVQPIFPIGLNQDWNLINQLNLNFASTDGGITGVPEIPSPYLNIKNPAAGYRSATGLADLNFTTLLSPVSHNDLHWGVGATFTFPTDAPYRELGSGKFSLGPAATVLKQTKDWTLGIQASQIFSVTGSSGRADISQLQLKPMAYVNLADSWYLFTNPIVVANWHTAGNEQWTLPVGGGVGNVFDVGDEKLNVRLESYYNVVRPDQSPTWTIGATAQVMFPK